MSNLYMIYFWWPQSIWFLFDFFLTPDLPQPGADVATLSQCLVDLAQQCGRWPSDWRVNDNHFSPLISSYSYMMLCMRMIKIGNIKNRRWRSRNAPDVKKAPFGKKVKKGTMSEDLGIYIYLIFHTQNNETYLTYLGMEWLRLGLPASPFWGKLFGRQLQGKRQGLKSIATG